MGRGANNNLRVANWLYDYLEEEGPKTVSAMKDYLNNVYRTTKGQRLARGYSSQQIAGVMRTSKLFHIVGEDRVWYSHWTRLPVSGGMVNEHEPNSTRGIFRTPKGTTNQQRTNVMLWDVRPIESVVDDMLNEDGQLPVHQIRKKFPQRIKAELKKRGVKL
tara:strand:- start:263 stop:745 length:483 start_codon:yes stop_codon:yes gene_type:complete